MRLFTKFRIMILFIVFLLLTTCYAPLVSPEGLDQYSAQCLNINNGQILYGPIKGFSTYLLESSGALNHTWTSNYAPGVMVRWLGDGRILRTIRTVGASDGGAGGGVQIVEWDGTVIWDFRYNTDGHLSHHDVRMLPNGNVLLIAWETKTLNEAIAAGRNPDYVTPEGFMPDHIIEVKPTGSTTGDIVWEWHVWDHLIQDYDPTKDNYGIVNAHPELVDVNYIEAPVVDWMHTNSIDYNEEFDQILLSVCYFNEIWVIDHSTTKQEAAGHSGGYYGHGGDLLYRWGNPQVYDMGTSSNQKLFMQHDATWIDEGYPGEGNILVFNNGQNRPGSHYSTIDEIILPINENGDYYIEPGSAFGPAEQTWIYIANPPTSFYAYYMSGASRLPNGDTLICNGVTGKLFEITPGGSTIWQYDMGSEVFKVEYIPPQEPEQPQPEVPKVFCSGSLSWSDIEPGATVSGSFQVQNIGGQNSTLNWTVDTSSLTWGTWTITPKSGKNLAPNDGPVTVHVSVVAPDEGNSEFQGFIRVENQDNSSDFDIVSVNLKTPVKIQTIPMRLYQIFMKWIHLFTENVWSIFEQLITLRS